MDWRHQSACREEDPELFFPVGNTGPALAQIEEAKKVCERCTVKEACLAWALKRRAARNRARMMENQNQF